MSLSRIQNGGIWLVCLEFSLVGVPPPVLFRLSAETALEGYLRAVQEGVEPRVEQVCRTLEPMGTVIAHHRSAHLVQSVTEEQGEVLVARYLFDQIYAIARPEALDPEHLAILHGIVAAKVMDNGVVVLDRPGIAASVRWPALGARGTRLTRQGHRIRA